MLKQRVITAVFLVIALLGALFNDNLLYWRAFISIAISIGYYEWLKFCAIEHTGLKVILMGAFIGVLYCLHLNITSVDTIILVLCLLWPLLFVFTFTSSLKVFHNSWLKAFVGILVLAGSGWLIIEFKAIDNGAWWICCFFLLVFAADIGAYFVGKRFGKTKLAPSISPGKTVEGLLGGLFLVVLIFVPILFSIFSIQAALLLLVTIVVSAVASVAGDLFESKLKRHVGLKDSSQILPGHGGVLDRIDSLLAGAPFFSVGLLLLGYLR